MYNIVVGAIINRPRAIDNRPYMRIVMRDDVDSVPYKTLFLHDRDN